MAPLTAAQEPRAEQQEPGTTGTRNARFLGLFRHHARHRSTSDDRGLDLLAVETARHVGLQGCPRNHGRLGLRLAWRRCRHCSIRNLGGCRLDGAGLFAQALQARKFRRLLPRPPFAAPPRFEFLLHLVRKEREVQGRLFAKAVQHARHLVRDPSLPLRREVVRSNRRRLHRALRALGAADPAPRVLADAASSDQSSRVHDNEKHHCEGEEPSDRRRAQQGLGRRFRWRCGGGVRPRRGPYHIECARRQKGRRRRAGHPLLTGLSGIAA
mmetsp:Transcript_24287/g.67533  ORF Transcript_24287/g.67533 Transcript_24287/m.67533 type:complete len:269 (+) Transcript_24287:1076-1882(+)